MRILAGDIGGTNTRFMLWSVQSGALRAEGPPVRFRNADFASLDAILERFADRCTGVTDACFGIAGPVEGRSVRLTNIPHWPEIRADHVAGRLNIADPLRVSLINDMPAHAASLCSIERDLPDHLIAVRAGAARSTGTQVIIAPGTGLGVGMLVHDSHSGLHRPTPTEAGHESLAVRDQAVWQLVESARRTTGDVLITREHLLSGPGLRLIYACLADPERPDLERAPQGEALTDPHNRDPIAARALDLFVRLLGELCGDCALAYLSTGGIYIAGSIANALRSRIGSSVFGEAFEQTGPQSMRALVRSIPVKLVTYEETGLLGAATYATWAEAKKV